MAPEVHAGAGYSILSDIYAAGVTLYRLVNGDTYLPSVSPADIPQACMEGKYPNRARHRDFVPRALRVLINRALDCDPTRRYQSAENMRHALEQITIQMNWNQQLLTDGIRWTAGWNKKSYEVILRHSPDDTWSVEARRGKSKRDLRRVTALCGAGLTKTDAQKLSRRILQDHVLGRIK